MEINEVKVGDMVTYKNKQGKQVKGKVIHRHDGKDASHLTGHVNIQKIGGVPSFPVTVHVSDIKPHITEETDMQNENVYTMIDSIQTGDTDRVETLFREIMNTKISDVLASNKEEVAKSMFNTNECAECEAEEVDEALKGNQHKIDANKNGKVDAHDFKLLRKKKGVKEEAEQVDEDTFEQGGKMKTDTKPRHVSPHFKHLKKRSYDEIRADALKRAGLTDVSKKSPAVKKEEAEYVDEGNAENKKKKNLALSPFGQTSGTNMKQARADHAASEPKDPYVHPDRSKMGTTALKNAIKRVRRPASYRYKPTLPEEATHEAYSDPYAAKKSAEMKKAHAATMADAKKEYDAARKPKFAKNFMKMKKEEVELEEGNAENKMKKNAYADAKGAANKNLDRGSQRRVDSRRTDEVDSIKKGIDNYAPKKAPVRNIIRGKVFGKLSDTETKMFARKRVKEDVNLQELDDTTTFSYLQKRHGMKTLTHFKPENKVSAKSEKGKTNALASIEKKREAEREISRKATKKAGMGAARDYKKGTYSGD